MISVVQLAAGTAVVTCGDVPTGGLSALTVEGWFRVLAISQANRPLLTKYGATGHEWALYVSRDGRAYFAVFSAGGVNIAHSGPGAVQYNRWIHVAGCYDGSDCAIFVDGADATEVSRSAGGAVSNTTQAVRLGGFIGEEGPGFIGRLGWSRVSRVCRYPGNIRGVDQPPTVDGNTIAQWNVSEGSGATLDNAEGTAAYDGVITGGAWATSETSDKWRAQAAVGEMFGRLWPVGVTMGAGAYA
jgi:hypothetical protein